MKQSKRDALIVDHLHLVKAIAVHISTQLPRCVNLDDLMGAGTLGLVDAADKFDSKRGTTFAGYAKWRIRGAMLDHLRDLDWASRDGRSKQQKFHEAWRTLAQQNGRAPFEQEMADALDVGLDDYRDLAREVAALDHAIAHTDAAQFDDGKRMEFAIADPDPRVYPDKSFERAELRTRLEQALAALPARHAQAIRLYFFEDRTMKDVGRQMGVNESRICQMVHRSLEKMRLAMAA